MFMDAPKAYSFSDMVLDLVEQRNILMRFVVFHVPAVVHTLIVVDVIYSWDIKGDDNRLDLTFRSFEEVKMSISSASLHVGCSVI